MEQNETASLQVKSADTAIYFSIPSHFTSSSLSDALSIADQGKTGRIVGETYGCLSHSVLGHGRYPKAVPQIQSLKQLRDYRIFAQTKGIRFNYLLNAPYSATRVSEITAIRHIAEVLEIVHPHSVTVSSLPIARLVRRESLNVLIHISTIAGVKTPEDLKPFLIYGPTVIVPHHDLARDFRKLKTLCDFVRDIGINIQLLVNESCLPDCTRRAAHYECLALGRNDDEYQRQCNIAKYSEPTNLLKSVWIRPEDIDWMYSEFGINHFKISGREKSASWLIDVVSAYLHGAYEGNLIELLAITPPWTISPGNELYVENTRLNGFLSGFPWESQEERHLYCEKWARLLLADGAMSIQTRSQICQETMCLTTCGTKENWQ